VSHDGTLMIYGAGDGMVMMTLAEPIPESGTIAILVLIASIIGIILASKYYGRNQEITNKNNLTGYYSNE